MRNTRPLAHLLLSLLALSCAEERSVDVSPQPSPSQGVARSTSTLDWRQDAERFESHGASWRGTVAGQTLEFREHRSHLALSVELQTSAPWRLAGPRTLESAGGAAVIASPTGVEDWHTITSRQPLRFSLQLNPNVAGLRLVSRTLEFLDEDAIPRLRMAPPYAIGKDDRRHALSATIGGCAISTDTRQPRRDHLIPPGARSCVLELRIPEALQLPARVDPSWMTTDSMAVRRLLHQEVTLEDGRLLVCGGADSSESTSCEIFDPVSETWSATGSMLSGKPREFAIAKLGDGRVLAPGNTNSEVFDPDTGTWSTTAGMGGTRELGSFRAVALENGSVLVAGGQNGNLFPIFCERFDPASESWLSAGILPSDFAEYASARLSDGRVLITGGRIFGDTRDTGAIYDPTSNSWRATGKMAEGHWAHQVAALPNGNAVVVAGTESTSGRSESYDAESNTFSPIAAISPARQFHAAHGLPDGTVLVAGGYGQDFSQPTPTTALLLPWANEWIPLGDLSDGRYQLLLASFRSGTQTKVIAVGGDGGGFGTVHGTTTTDIIRGRLIGEACGNAAQCFSGICVDGVCCDSACDGSCESCIAADTGGADGHCGFIQDGADPGDECADPSDSGCVTGSCDGAGACGILADNTICRGPACQGAQIATGTCEAGKCVNSYVNCGKFACTDATCLDSCSTNSECAPENVCDTRTSTCTTGFCRTNSVLVRSAGEVDCAPYACLYGSSCATNCADDSHCAAPNVCSRGICGPSQPAEESGCGCRIASGRDEPRLAWLLVMLLPWLRRRCAT